MNILFLTITLQSVTHRDGPLLLLLLLFERPRSMFFYFQIHQTMRRSLDLLSTRASAEGKAHRIAEDID
jgi:hypothetical protein